MEQEFTATVVRIERQTEEIFLIELESAALKDESPFEVISARLSLDEMAASVGSRLAITIAAGDKVRLVVRPESRQGDQIGSGRSQVEQEFEGATSRKKGKPVGTFVMRRTGLSECGEAGGCRRIRVTKVADKTSLS